MHIFTNIEHARLFIRMVIAHALLATRLGATLAFFETQYPINYQYYYPTLHRKIYEEPLDDDEMNRLLDKVKLDALDAFTVVIDDYEDEDFLENYMSNDPEKMANAASKMIPLILDDLTLNLDSIFNYRINRVNRIIALAKKPAFKLPKFEIPFPW